MRMVVPDRDGHQVLGPGAPWRPEGDGHVQFSGQESGGAAGGRHLVQLQAYIGPFAAEPAQDVRQRVEQCGGDEPQAQSARLTARRPSGVDGGRRHFLQRPPRPGEERLARGGREHALARTVEQPGAGLALQVGDLFGQRGLRDAQRVSCSAEVSVLGEGERVPQMPCLHDHPFHT